MRAGSSQQVLQPPGDAAREARRLVWVALLYVGLTGLLAYPLPLRLASDLIATGADPDLCMWALAWDTHAFIHQPLALFDANIFYPAHHTLAYSENFIGSAVFAAPILWLTGNPVLAMNVVELLSVVLCALGAYVLARRVGLRPAGAVLAGVIFGFAPARFMRIEQLHLATIQWVPFGLASLHAYLDGGRRIDLRLAALFVTLQALTSGHGVVFLAVAALGLVVFRALQGEPVALMRRVRDLGVPGAIALVPAALVFLQYRAAQADAPMLRRGLDDFGVAISSYFASPSHVHAFVLAHLPAWFTEPPPDAYLFPGFLPLLLAAAAVALRVTARVDRPPAPPGRWWRYAALTLEVAAVLLVAAGIFVIASGEGGLRVGTTVLFTARRAWRIWLFAGIAIALRIALAGRAPIDLRARVRRPLSRLRDRRLTRRRDVTVFYALLTLVCFWLTLGPPIGLWRWTYWMPVLSFLRVPSRFILLEMLGLAVLAGLGFERATARARPGLRIAAAVAVGVLLVAEFAAMPLETHPYRVEIPAIDRWLDTRPKPFAVAEVPVPDSLSHVIQAQRDALYMLHSMGHWQKTVHGYSGTEPPVHKTLYAQLVRFPDDDSVRSLTNLGVTYIVMHPDLYPPAEIADVEQRFARYKDWLTLEHEERDGRVYSLRRPIAK